MDRETKRLLWPIKVMVVVILVSAGLFYLLAQAEGREVSFLQCLFMVAITISTAGYEDPLNCKDSPVLMIFAIGAILCYMVVVAYAISNFTAFLVEGRLKKYFIRKNSLKRIRKMEDHVIICGIKDVGMFAAEELHAGRRPFVVIEEDEERLRALREQMPNLVWLEGDAAEDHILEDAGVRKARGLIAALDGDKDNLYLVLAAKELNPHISVVAKYNAPKTERKLRKAGAAHVVCPNRIGGLRIASELMRPEVVSFLDAMLRDRAEDGTRVEQAVVGESAAAVGKTLNQLRQETGVLVISYRAAAGRETVYNPSGEEKAAAGMVLFFIANPAERRLMEKAVGGA